MQFKKKSSCSWRDHRENCWYINIGRLKPDRVLLQAGRLEQNHRTYPRASSSISAGLVFPCKHLTCIMGTANVLPIFIAMQFYTQAPKGQSYLLPPAIDISFRNRKRTWKILMKLQKHFQLFKIYIYPVLLQREGAIYQFSCHIKTFLKNTNVRRWTFMNY